MKHMKFLNKIPRKLFLIQKRTYQFIRPYAKQKCILFIIGCQRSGTSLMLRIFDNDLNTNTYGEFSKLSFKNNAPKGMRSRLNSFDSVKKEIQKDKAAFIILKPLVESQNILRLLECFDNSKALWMYRNYKDVALSDLKRFGIKSGINNLRPIVENRNGNWRSEKVSERVRKIILSHFSEDMNPYDAAVLFWFARNDLFFELNLDKNPNILMCRYESLITDPVNVISGIYENLDQNFPGEKITAEIHSKSLKKGMDITISTEIGHLAEALLDKLDKVYYRLHPTEMD